MGITTWYFLRHAPGHLEPVSRKAFEAFFFDDARLAISNDGYVRHAQVVVDLVERRPVQIVQVGFFQDRVHEDGSIDRKSRREVMRTAGEAAFGGISLTKKPPGVIEAGHRFAQRRLEHLQNWEPNDRDLAALRELVNRKAKARLM